jgi:hypothetical protein
MGDLASTQAGTRVNVEQAPKRAMQEPTRLRNGEGRCEWGPTSDTGPTCPAGVVTPACVHRETDRNTGSPLR